MVDLADRYIITSNRESGFGRYDIQMEPRNRAGDAIIIEFKVNNPRKEKTLEDTVQTALRQIAEKQYEAALLERGFPASLQIIPCRIAAIKASSCSASVYCGAVNGYNHSVYS